MAVQEPQTEIINAIVAAGLVPTDDDLTQLTEAIKLLGRIPFVEDSGSVNALVANPAPAFTAYAQPMIIAIQVAYTSTGNTTLNVSGLGAVPLLRMSGAQLTPGDLIVNGVILVGYDGANFQLLTFPASLTYPPPASLWHYGVDLSSSANSVVVSNVDPTTLTLWSTGLPLAVKIANTNSGASTIALNGLSPVPIKRGSGANLQAGDLASGYIALMIYDGAEAQLINPQVAYGSVGSGDTVIDPLDPYWLSVNSLGISSTPPSPSLGDTYLIPVGATGAWSGLSGEIAQYTADGWVYRSYPPSSLVGTSDTMDYYQNIGGNVWKQVVIPSKGLLYFYGQL